STARAHDEQIERAVAVAAQAGVPEEAALVGPDELPLRLPPARCAIRYRDGATVHPARLVPALRRAGPGTGVTSHERTPVLGVEQKELRCASGVVRAEEIVLATNAAAARWPAQRSLAVFRSAIVVTEPVADLAGRIGWENGEGVYDGRTYL